MMESGITFFDLETTNLKGNLGRVLCGAFLTLETDEPTVISETNRKYKGKRLGDDSKVVEKCRDIINGSWIVVGWNSKLFDIPFLNARLRINNLAPVEKRMHLDLMYYARGQFIKLNSSRLDAVAKAFHFDDQKTNLLYDTWIEASLGNKESMGYIEEHCVQDVKVLREAWRVLKPFVRNIHY